MRCVVTATIAMETVLTALRNGLTAPSTSTASENMASTNVANPITQHFRIGRQVASAGPDMAWKIYEATRICDGKVDRSCVMQVDII